MYTSEVGDKTNHTSKYTVCSIKDLESHMISSLNVVTHFLLSHVATHVITIVLYVFGTTHLVPVRLAQK